MEQIENVTPGELKVFIQEHHEPGYLLVDVRQPEEYKEGHIPGAKLIPLPELETRLQEITGNRDMVFYCRSGNRSMAGATFVADSKITHGNIYNLLGGITAWDGKELRDFPRTQVFDKNKNHRELLFQAMDLEKGAWRFYSHVLERSFSEPFFPTPSRKSKKRRKPMQG